MNEFNKIGELVQIRTYRDQDLDALVEVGKDDKIWEFYRLRGWTEAKQMIAWEEKYKSYDNFRHFTILDRAQNKVIRYTGIWNIKWNEKTGTIGSTFIHSTYWGRGYNRESKKILIEHCFSDLELKKLILGCDIDNKRSYFSAIKAGFEFKEIKENFSKNVDGSFANFAFFELIHS